MLTFLLSQFSGFFLFSVSLFEYCHVSAFELVMGCDVSDRTVQSDVVVMLDVLFNHSAGRRQEKAVLPDGCIHP